MATVVLLGTLDTKAAEYAFLRDRLHEEGCATLLVDAGVNGSSMAVAVTADQVAAAAGEDRGRLAAAHDRGPAMAAMTRGAVAVVRRLHDTGRLDALVGLGGSGGSSLVGAAARALPLGVPKVLVSTLASGDLAPYVGTTDLVVIPAIADVAGINHVTERAFGTAATVVAAMARAAGSFASRLPDRPVVAATMFGVTTPGVTAARRELEGRGYEVIVFHATGAGGRAMEALVRDGVVTGVLDITTTELADELVGGVFSAGPDRLTAAGELGLPQVVSLGALDIVNFGPLDTVPARFRERTVYRHTAEVTLMRTTPVECAELGRVLARKVNAARGPVAVFVPTAGLSSIGVPGGPFRDAVADAALVRELRAALRPDIEVVQVDSDVNDPAFARAMAVRLDELYRSWASGSRKRRAEEVPDELGTGVAAAAAHP